MSTLDIESAVEITSTFSADLIRIDEPTRRAVGPRPAFGTPYGIRLSAELSAVIAHWLARAQWRHGIPPSHPGSRRDTP